MDKNKKYNIFSKINFNIKNINIEVMKYDVFINKINLYLII